MKRWAAAAGTAALLCGCGAAGPVPGSDGKAHYRCDQDIEFSVRFANDEATLDAGARGVQQLLRDAGGLTPQHTVFSSSSMRAEFGLGSDGREALLYFTDPAMQAHCVRAD